MAGLGRPSRFAALLDSDGEAAGGGPPPCGVGEPQDEAGAEGELERLAAEAVAALEVGGDGVERMLRVPQRHPDGRAHEAWLQARRHRLTASRFAAACGAPGARAGRGATAQEMLDMPEADPGQALLFGVQAEADARQEYLAQRRAELAPLAVEVQEVGLCVWREEPWLAGSPDGVCWEGGEPAGLLEVKTARRWQGKFDADLPVEWTYQAIFEGDAQASFSSNLLAPGPLRMRMSCLARIVVSVRSVDPCAYLSLVLRCLLLARVARISLPAARPTGWLACVCVCECAGVCVCVYGRDINGREWRMMRFLSLLAAPWLPSPCSAALAGAGLHADRLGSARRGSELVRPVPVDARPLRAAARVVRRPALGGAHVPGAAQLLLRVVPAAARAARAT
ncbi:unnamed protein product [Prorocentrum cordatum]|uniref:YqaJ viral recombinase domain-containing protein n=1 Tax=Prorocentrum cordatum TaxID=2364126 RepID=A0ABN9UXQ4_9DINO|nr:unnamed protein product [Polarella glacialis]